MDEGWNSSGVEKGRVRLNVLKEICPRDLRSS